MKRAVVVFAMGFLLASVYAQQVEQIKATKEIKDPSIPENVKNSFSSGFESASNVKWHKEKLQEYTADFKMNGENATATFDNQGNLVRSKIMITENDLPMTVINAVSKKYPGYHFGKIEQINTMSATSYEIKVKKGMKSHKVLYGANGQVVQKGKKGKG